MNFLYPSALAFAALVPLIVILYMLRRRRRTVTVSSTLLWKQLADRAPRHRALGRIRGLLSLLLNLLIFLLIVLALAQPDLEGFFKTRSTVIVLDSRARMQAVGADGKSAFDRARELARQMVRRARGANQFAIVAAGAEPWTISPFSDDRRALGNQVDAAGPSDAGGDLAPAIELARSLVASRQGEGRVVVLTDRPLDAATDPVDVIAVGEPADNAGITQFALRSSPAGPQTQELFLRVDNFSREPGEVEIELRLDGQLFDVLHAGIPAGEAFETVRAIAADELADGNGWLTATLTRPDALPIDNLARAVAPLREKPRVLLITQGNWFLEKALAADSSIAFELLGPEAWRAGMENSFDVVVFDDWLPTDPATAERPANGNFLFVGRNPWSSNEPSISNPAVTDTDAQSPLLHGIAIDAGRITRAYELSIPESVGAISKPVRSADDPLVATIEDPENPSRRSAAFAFRVGDSDLPLRIAFPILVSNTVHWLAGRHDRETVRAGQIVPLEPAAQMAARPDGRSPSRVTGAYRPAENGFYEITDRKSSEWIAVNTSDARESDLRQAAASGGSPAILAAALGLEPWRWLVLAAILLSLFEWIAFHRRWTE